MTVILRIFITNLPIFYLTYTYISIAFSRLPRKPVRENVAALMQFASAMIFLYLFS